jgi:hypothetical protein
VELVGCEDDETGNPNSDVGNTSLALREAHKNNILKEKLEQFVL